MSNENKKNYYDNKILYALSKIDYAKSKKDNDKNVNALSRIYSVFLTYKDNVKLEVLMKMTQLPREIIVKKLKWLKELGVINWEGTYLSQEKEIKRQPIDHRSYLLNLEEKCKEKGINFPENWKVRDPTAEELEALHKGEQIEHKESEKPQGDWIEIELEKDIVIKTTKQKLKERLLG